jgi:hypothetical protein
VSRIDEPASAIAASHCLTARTIDDRGTTRLHPRPCGWCIWPVPVLTGMVDEFNVRAGYDPRRGTHQRHDARVFASLSRADQVAAVLEAQEFEPMETIAVVTADEEGAVPSWL